MYRAFPETKLITMACFRHGGLKKSTIDHRLTRATRAGFDLTTHVLGSIRFGTFLKVRVCRFHVGPCRSMLVHVGPCWSMFVHVGPCWSMLVQFVHYTSCFARGAVPCMPKFEGTRSNLDRGGSDSRLFVSCRPDAVSLVLSGLVGVLCSWSAGPAILH